MCGNATLPMLSLWCLVGLRGFPLFFFGSLTGFYGIESQRCKASNVFKSLHQKTQGKPGDNFRKRRFIWAENWVKFSLIGENSTHIERISPFIDSYKESRKPKMDGAGDTRPQIDSRI